PLQTAQCPQLPASQGMRCRGARLGSTDVQEAQIEIHLIPAKVHEFTGSEPVAEGQQDHGRVPVACGRLDQPLHLGLREMLPSAVLCIFTSPWCNCFTSPWCNCRNFAGWRDQS